MSPISLKRNHAQGKPLTVRLDANLERRLQSAAAHEGVSVSALVREAITDRLDRSAAGSSLWDRIEPSVLKRGPSRAPRGSGPASRDSATAKRSTHQDFAAGLEAEAATKWRRLEK